MIVPILHRLVISSGSGTRYWDPMTEVPSLAATAGHRTTTAGVIAAPATTLEGCTENWIDPAGT